MLLAHAESRNCGPRRGEPVEASEANEISVRERREMKACVSSQLARRPAHWASGSRAARRFFCERLAGGAGKRQSFVRALFFAPPDT